MPLYQSESKHVMNLEFERKKELDRRRNLRLLQVRHQSRDFARFIRENLKAEENDRKHKFFECKKKQIYEKKTEDLKRLQQLYEICLENIGESHREAANQPDEILTRQLEEAEKNAKAAQRGAEARRKQKMLESIEREKYEASRKMKQAARKKEDFRAHVISSLPKTVVNSGLLQKQSSTPIELEDNRPVLKELPKNLTRNPTCREEEVTSGGSPLRGRQLCRREEHATDQHQAKEENLKECCCDYVVCWCHQQTSPTSLRRCQSESTLTDSPTDKEQKSDSLYKRLKTRSRSCSPRSVRTLNYCDVGNLYESNQRSFVKVTHHSSPPPEISENISKNKIAEDQSCVKKRDPKLLEKKTSERSARALQREKLKREWQQLMQDFKQISRAQVEKKNKLKLQVGVFQRARDVDAKKEAKQKKLIDVFEKFLCSQKTMDTKSQSITNNAQHLEEEETSLPTLNLAEYQQLDMDDQTCNPSQLTNTMQFSENVVHSEFQSQVSQSLSRSAGLQATSEVSTLNERSRAGEISPSRSGFQQVNSEVSTLNQVESRVQENPSSSRSANVQVTSEVSTVVPRARAGGRSPCQSTPSSHSRSGHSRSHRSGSRGRGNSQVTIHTPSNVVHIDVEPKEKSREHKRKCPKSHYSAPGDSSTSYGSPPQNLTPSQRELVEGLLNQVSRQAINRDLRNYIQKLLSMSRESIDELNVSSGDFANCSPQQNIRDDLTKLSHLTELYADKVNTLVDIFEEVDEQYSPDRYYSPPPASRMGNSPNPSPNRISPQKPPSPSSPCPNVPFSAGLTSPPNPFSLGPGSSCPFDDEFHTPNWELDEQFFTPQAATPGPPPPRQQCPKPGTRSRSPQVRQPPCPPASRPACPPQRRSPCPQTKAGPSRTPQKKQPCALPPLHHGPCSPTPRPTTPQRTARPTTPLRSGRPTTPQQTARPTTPQHTGRPTTPASSRGPSPGPQKKPFKDQIQTPFGLSSNLLPHPNEAFQQQQPGPCDAQPNFFTPGAVSVPPNFQTIEEESEESSFNAFSGLPFQAPSHMGSVTEEQFNPQYQQENFTSVGEMEDAVARFQQIKRGELPPQSGADFGGNGFGGPQNFTDDFVQSQQCPNDFGGPQNFTDDFGGAQGFANDFGAGEFGNEEFGGDINEILQMEAPPEDGGVEYPADFPPQTDVFGPGFHWDAANLSEPSWPHSYPYGAVGGHDMSSRHHIAIDSSFDANAVSYPLNSEKLNSIRKKLSEISNDQYRQVIQMLQADCDEDQDRYRKMLRRVASGPFEDPDSTLAPVPHRSPTRREHSSPRHSPHSSPRTPHSSRASSRVSSAFNESALHNQPIDNLTSLAILARSLNDSNILNDTKNC